MPTRRSLAPTFKAPHKCYDKLNAMNSIVIFSHKNRNQWKSLCTLYRCGQLLCLAAISEQLLIKSFFSEQMFYADNGELINAPLFGSTLRLRLRFWLRLHSQQTNLHNVVGEGIWHPYTTEETKPNALVHENEIHLWYLVMLVYIRRNINDKNCIASSGKWHAACGKRKVASGEH